MIRTISKAAPLALAALVALSGMAGAQLKTPRPSPGATVKQTIGITELTVAYSRPGVKNRTIWGGLVPYDTLWRTGANEATTFTTSTEISFGGQKLAPGTYAVVTIPSKGEWTLALNTDKDMWGANGYQQGKDVMRVKATPTAAEHQEWMEFSFEDLTPTSANLVLRWEKLHLAVPITVDVNGTTLAGIRAVMDTAAANNWRTRNAAARWCVDNDQAMADARGWLDQALKIEKNYSTLGTLARLQMKDGKKSEAIATAEQAIAAGKAAKPPVDTAQMENTMKEWKAAK
jgi:hypothetical protein